MKLSRDDTQGFYLLEFLFALIILSVILLISIREQTSAIRRVQRFQEKIEEFPEPPSSLLLCSQTPLLDERFYSCSSLNEGESLHLFVMAGGSDAP
jgi:hypothetical protein